MVIGSVLYFLFPWAAQHRSNHEAIQAAHFQSKTFEEDHMFYGMNISDCEGEGNMNNKTSKEDSNLLNKGTPALPPRGKESGAIPKIPKVHDNYVNMGAMKQVPLEDKVAQYLLHKVEIGQCPNCSDICAEVTPAEVKHDTMQEISSGETSENVVCRDLQIEAVVCHVPESMAPLISETSHSTSSGVSGSSPPCIQVTTAV